ncbi:MAG: hypothetical protein ACKO86_14030, partial [Dolichospermum sp.]
PQATTVAFNDGIDAGLKYWLVFMLGCLFLGYSAPMSILFGGIAGVGGGCIIAWWRSQEALQTQLPKDVLEEDTEQPSDRGAKRRIRKPTRRFRRASTTFNFRFWEK